jgi:hypothetical protein
MKTLSHHLEELPENTVCLARGRNKPQLVKPLRFPYCFVPAMITQLTLTSRHSSESRDWREGCPELGNS